MTRAQFVQRAVRAAERELKIPEGWWGTYRDVRGPNGRRVRFSSHSLSWIVSVNGQGRGGGYHSRATAIGKAKRL